MLFSIYALAIRNNAPVKYLVANRSTNTTSPAPENIFTKYMMVFGATSGMSGIAIAVGLIMTSRTKNQITQKPS